MFIKVFFKHELNSFEQEVLYEWFNVQNEEYDKDGYWMKCIIQLDSTDSLWRLQTAAGRQALLCGTEDNKHIEFLQQG
ncbi:hypothetical protein [Paenibacillus lautus]|uniref:hypothetical protein n=1 Tax=Paenibacillus lautus TaxID=1401 RepID=UPI001C7DAA46|nr:hypothetical protein [Paenibacillus lautus]MBX4152286.1 hypothetical protein [Paenibacillus lautus]